MEPLLYVMAILGCADGATACTEARLAGYRFENKQQCERAIEDQLMAATDLSFPTISARCVSERQYIAQTRNPGKARTFLAGLTRFGN